MPNEPELIVDTVVDPRKWEEAIELLHEALRITEGGLYYPTLWQRITVFLKENA